MNYILKNPYLATFAKYRYLLANLISRDLKVKYRRSTLGLLWSVLNPLLMAFIITAVFQTIFRTSTENFAVYYLAGSLIFNFMNEATSGAMGSVVGGSALIKKVYIPKYIFPAEKVLFAFVNMLFSMIALVIMVVLTKMGVIFGSSPDALLLGPTMLLSFVPMLYTLVFSMGLGFVLAALNVYFRDVNHLYSVWVLAWMYLTPVIYPVDLVKNTPIMKVLVLNPMYYYVTYFRSVLMSAEVPDFNFNLICIGTSVVMLIIGLIVFKKNQDRFILFI